MQIPDLLRNKSFWTALLGIVLMIAVNLWPELAGRTEELTVAILIIISLVVGGFTVTDVQASRERVARYQAELRIK